MRHDATRAFRSLVYQFLLNEPAVAAADEFQAFRAEALASPRARKADYQARETGGEQSQLDMLRASGCTIAQGYLIARPTPAENLEAVIAQLPAMKRPTVNQLYGSDDYEITTVADKAGVNLLIPALKGAGAEDILEIPIAKIVR